MTNAIKVLLQMTNGSLQLESTIDKLCPLIDWLISRSIEVIRRGHTQAYGRGKLKR
jgi:hypothetical protein